MTSIDTIGAASDVGGDLGVAGSVFWRDADDGVPGRGFWLARGSISSDCFFVARSGREANPLV